MSVLETIVSRMVNDPAFADSVLADAEKTLEEYGLPAEEMEKFKKMSRADFDAFVSASPEERKSFGLNYVGTANGGIWRTTNGG